MLTRNLLRSIGASVRSAPLKAAAPSTAFPLTLPSIGTSIRFYSAVGQPRPNNVGIIGMDVYFPRTYVKQEQLEEHDNAGKGKYTIGLMQKNMAFCDDREDINSMALTVVHRLLEAYNIEPSQVGRVEVGTETIIDKSKAVKTTLMNLFKDNPSVEGIDTTNACYGGTAALLNAINWVESSSWDGRYAVVVAGDIAVYEKGPARPTGGCGIVAMLIGKDAPLVVEPGLRGVYMEDAYDFYKPNLESEYPIVDGKLSVSCYLRALDSCYAQYREKFQYHTNQTFDLSKADYSLFHSPYTKLVYRSYARLLYNDALNAAANDPRYAALAPFRNLSKEQSYTDKDLTKVLDNMAKDGFESKVAPSQLLSQELGNTYCGSLYCNLLALLSNKPSPQLINNRLLMFSYGSGLAATMFSIKPVGSYAHISEKAQIHERLAQRIAVPPSKFHEILALRERTHSAASYAPSADAGTGADLFPATYQLVAIDALKRRAYARV